MNDPALDDLFRQARDHSAPPDLWPRIAARAGRDGSRPWRAAAALLVGGLSYVLVATTLRSNREPHDAVSGVVAASWPYLRATADDADRTLLQQLASEAARRPR